MTDGSRTAWLHMIHSFPLLDALLLSRAPRSRASQGTRAVLWGPPQEMLEIPQGTVKATVLIETLPAAFEMDEILYELRRHSAGLNCGRWDYIFSFIKTTRADPAFVMPDRWLAPPNTTARSR